VVRSFVGWVGIGSMSAPHRHGPPPVAHSRVGLSNLGFQEAPERLNPFESIGGEGWEGLNLTESIRGMAGDRLNPTQAMRALANPR
jgi:hypothetical protein